MALPYDLSTYLNRSTDLDPPNDLFTHSLVHLFPCSKAMTRAAPLSRLGLGLAHESIFPTPFGAPHLRSRAASQCWWWWSRRRVSGKGVPLFGRFGLFGQIPSLRQLPKNPKNAEKFGFSKFSIQSKREAKPQRFAGTSQLILVQSLLYFKSSTNDCNYTTISFNIIQIAFP